MTLEDKIKATENVLRKAYFENNGKLFISFSGGKDSTILRHIALRLFPELKVVFSNTTNELSEVIKYVKTFPNIITVKPIVDFKNVVKKHGFPLISKEVSQKVYELKHSHGRTTRHTRFYGDKKGNGRLATKWRFVAEQEFDVTHKCCQILKKDPLGKWAKKEDLKPIIALMSDESRLRQQLALYGNDENGKVYPFLRTGWAEEDIWTYAKLYNIRFAECYYDRWINGVFIPKRDRTGCEYCGFGITLEKENRFERSKLTAPKRYAKMMALENNGVTFEDAIEIVKKESVKPELDVYGGKIITKTKGWNDFDIYKWKSTTVTKSCPHCSSKNVEKGYDWTKTFFDTPHPVTGNKRKIEVHTHDYECNDCKRTFFNDLHLFNQLLNVSNRLIEYVHNNMDNTWEEIITKTGLDYETLNDVIWLHEDIRKTVEEKYLPLYTRFGAKVDFKIR